MSLTDPTLSVGFVGIGVAAVDTTLGGSYFENLISGASVVGLGLGVTSPGSFVPGWCAYTGNGELGVWYSDFTVVGAGVEYFTLEYGLKLE